ncbi:MAG: DHH family phosphoesterase [Nanoarchaeota archaeon]
MGDIKESLEKQICHLAKKFLQKAENNEIQIISHFDTDGVSSAAIMTKTLKLLDKKFTLIITKSLEEKIIKTIPKNKLTLFLDLASNSLGHIQNAGLKEVFIIDHHQISQKIPDEIEIINPELHKSQKISSSGLVYLFCKELCSKAKDFAKLAVLGMVGDLLEKEIDKMNNGILEDGEIKRKRGLLIYPSTRPLNRVLEYSSSPFIPGITGNAKGVLELLRDINLTPKSGKYKSIIDLDSEEMEKLVTAIMLRNPRAKYKDIIGDIFLIKMFNKLEDAREISAAVNACSRLGESEIALQFLMEIPKAKKKAEAIHIKYRQHLIEALRIANEQEKIMGNGFVIINTKEKIKDTIVGTVASILSSSSIYDEGTAIITMAHYEDKIKISARLAGRKGRNLREVLARVVSQVGGEVGGHDAAAGAIISQENEAAFIELLKKNLEIEMVKV